MKNLVIVSLDKTYDSLELDKIIKTQKFEIRGKSPFVSNFKLIDDKEKTKPLCGF